MATSPCEWGFVDPSVLAGGAKRRRKEVTCR
jgi:hypothetical protein